jgi:hypothetical protein
VPASAGFQAWVRLVGPHAGPLDAALSILLVSRRDD